MSTLCNIRSAQTNHSTSESHFAFLSHLYPSVLGDFFSLFFGISNIMAQLQLLEEHAFLQARVALNQFGPRRDQWRAFMNGPSWAFERCMRTQFVPIASRFCVICQMGINGL
jgi:hypothetical protein